MRATIGFTRVVHLFSAFWTLALAVLIFGDVVGRGVFNQPIPGTKEILQNSVVTITFLQVPLAIYSGSMLRTSIFADAVPPFLRRVLRTVGATLGLVVFLGLIWSTWPAFQDAYRIGEYEGEGSLRVPTWPVRGVVLVMSAFGGWAYLTMIWLDWRGKLIDDVEAPGALSTVGKGAADGR
ncbi:MAG: TRAP transporter small permease [Pseudomonadota bacterium]